MATVRAREAREEAERRRKAAEEREAEALHLKTEQEERERVRREDKRVHAQALAWGKPELRTRTRGTVLERACGVWADAKARFKPSEWEYNMVRPSRLPWAERY